MKFAAPPHTSEIFLPSGPVRAEDGFVTVDSPTDADIRALAHAGFVAEPEKAATKAVAPPPATEKE